MTRLTALELERMTESERIRYERKRISSDLRTRALRLIRQNDMTIMELEQWFRE